MYFYINYIYIHTLFLICDATFGGHQFESLKAWTRQFITYKDVVGKYYKLSSTDMQDDIAMSHKSGLVKFWFIARVRYMIIYSTCKCVYIKNIHLFELSTPLIGIYIYILYLFWGSCIALYNIVTFKVHPEIWMLTSLWYNFRTSELVGLYVAWVYNPSALKSTEPQVQTHRSVRAVWLVHGYTLDNPVPYKIGDGNLHVK